MDRATQIKRECDNLAQMLIDKNARYGDSALSPVRVFSRASAEEQILVRIDDKLSRLARGKGAEDEDVILDLLGYLILLRISRTPNGQAERRTEPRSQPTRPWREGLSEDELERFIDLAFETIALFGCAPANLKMEAQRWVDAASPSLAHLCDALRADREAVCNALRIDVESELETIVRAIEKMEADLHRASVPVAKIAAERDALKVRIAHLETELQKTYQLATDMNASADKWCAKYRAAERAFGWVALKDIRPGTLFETRPEPYGSNNLGLRYPDGRFSWLTGGRQPLEVHAWPASCAASDDRVLVLLAGLDGAGCDRIVKAYRESGEDKFAEKPAPKLRRWIATHKPGAGPVGLEVINGSGDTILIEKTTSTLVGEIIPAFERALNYRGWPTKIVNNDKLQVDLPEPLMLSAHAPMGATFEIELVKEPVSV